MRASPARPVRVIVQMGTSLIRESSETSLTRESASYTGRFATKQTYWLRRTKYIYDNYRYLMVPGRAAAVVCM